MSLMYINQRCAWARILDDCNVRCNDEDMRSAHPCSSFRCISTVCFSHSVIKAAGKGYVTGLMNTLYPEGVISLQYVDDTLLFLEKDTHAA
jgi:hypothetical protein